MWCRVQQREHWACASNLGLAAGLCFCPSHFAGRPLRGGTGLVKSGFDDGHALLLAFGGGQAYCFTQATMLLAGVTAHSLPLLR